MLVDAGISCREIERRMKRLSLPMERIRAVFISHEHSDHISGLATLSRKYNLPVYITEETQRFSRLKLEPSLVRRFVAGTPVTISDMTVSPFRKFHDAGDPHSFTISSGGVTTGVFTDIGFACSEVVRHFRQCHAAFLESNYDEGMLMNGSYPVHLKKRITDDHGHLSNSQALALFLQHRPGIMQHLVLSHLSKNNNDPELVATLFAQHRGNVNIVVASRYQETELLRVQPGEIVSSSNPAPPHGPSGQLSLF